MISAAAPPSAFVSWGKVTVFLLMGLVLLLIGGCTQLDYRELAASDSQLPRQVELGETPFHAQTLHHCGPASLAMLLNAQGVPARPDELAHVTYLPDREGSLGLELLATPRQYQLMGYLVTPKLGALLAEVAAGQPVLILQNLGLSWLPRWHYAVLIGFDLDKREAILRSGTTERLVMRLNTFERTWLRGENWAMLALEPGDLPAVPRELDYLQAAMGLEKAGATDAAGRAYQRAVQAWPESVSTWMAWGNHQYAKNELAGAGEAYQYVIDLNEQFAPAYNNLAQVMAELGQWEVAQQVLHQAVARGGHHTATYQQTLRDIQQLKAAALAEPE